MTRRTVIRPGLLIDGTGAAPQRDVAVVIEDERIAWVGSAREVADAPDADRVIDASDGTLLPGLIDTHVHLCMNAGRETPVKLSTASDTEVGLLALANAQRALRAGLTTVRDLGGRGLVMLSVRDAIDGGVVLGPRIIAAGQGITITGGHGHRISVEADSEPELRKAARGLFKAGADVIKLFGTGGNGTPSSNPTLAQYTVEQFRAMVEEAERVGKQVTTHVHGTPGIRNAVEAGVHCLEHCSFMTTDGDYLYEAALGQEIVARGIAVSMALPMRWRVRADSEELLSQLNERQRAQRKLVEGKLSSIRALRELGATLIASSDAGTAMTYIEDMPLFLEWLVREIGMTPQEAIGAATGVPARAMNLGQEIGSVQAGRLADLLLVDGDPTTDMLALRNVRRVLRSGVTIVKDGQLVEGDPA